VVCGCGVMSRSPILVEILGYTGFDFVFIDTEHVPIGSDMTLGTSSGLRRPAVLWP